MFYGQGQTQVEPNFEAMGLIFTKTNAYGATWNTTATIDADLALVKNFPIAILTNSDKSSETKIFVNNGTAWKAAVVA